MQPLNSSSNNNNRSKCSSRQPNSPQILRTCWVVESAASLLELLQQTPTTLPIVCRRRLISFHTMRPPRVLAHSTILLCSALHLTILRGNGLIYPAILTQLQHRIPRPHLQYLTILPYSKNSGQTAYFSYSITRKVPTSNILLQGS